MLMQYMRSSGQQRTALFATVLISIGAHCDFAVAEDLKDRLLREAPGAWAELQKATLKYEGRINRKGEPTVGLELQTYKGFTCNYRFRGDGENFLFESACVEQGGTRERIFCANSDYAFKLKRSIGAEPWVVTNLESEQSSMLAGLDNDTREIGVSYRLDDQTLEWSLQQSSFKVLSVTPCEKDGRTVAEMRFTSDSFRRPDYQIRSGTVLLDPERSWAVLGYSIDVMLDVLAKVDAKVTYAGDGSSFPIPLRFVHVFAATLPEGAVERRETVVFSEVKRCTASAEDFRLAAFGFQEPVAREPADGDKRWYLLISAAAVLFVAAVGLRAWASRRRAANN